MKGCENISQNISYNAKSLNIISKYMLLCILGWVFGLTTENAENVSRLRAESVSSMSSFASSESSNTRDKLNKLRYVNIDLVQSVV